MTDDFTPRERHVLRLARLVRIYPHHLDKVFDTPYGPLRPGDVVELVRCDDPYTKVRPGTQGIVIDVDAHDAFDPGKVWVGWDDGSWLAILPLAGDVIRHVRSPFESVERLDDPVGPAL